VTSPRWTRGLVGALLVLAAALTAASDEASDARLPVPDAAARTAAVAELRKEHRDDLRSKDVESRRTLAATLLERAAADEQEPAVRWALLELGGELAEQAHDVPLALDAATRLGSLFQVPAVERRLQALDAAVRGSKEPAVSAEAATAYVDVAGDALAADDPATAATALAGARKHAGTAKLGGLAARAAALAELLPGFRRAASAAGTAAAALAAAPDDPAANEAVGRFLAFGRGDWAGGLPHLARSDSGELSEVAAEDLQKPEDAARRQALADRWWELAQHEKDALSRARMLARAARLYETEPEGGAEERRAMVRDRLATLTWLAWGREVALTKDFSKAGPDQFTLGAVRAYIAEQRVDRSRDGWRTRLPRFPQVAFAPGVEHLWHLDTNHGAMTIRLFADTAPSHVANFVYLTELGFFDGLTFHRVIPGFMAQGGCPKGTGGGDPGYTFEGEFHPKGRKHDRPGVLSMANTGQPSSDGSQFFLTFGPAAHLDGKHTVFGELVEGEDVLRKLEGQGTPAGTPKSELVIRSARVSSR